MASETLDTTDQESTMKKSSSSSWKIITGSLDHTLTCESSLITVDNSDRKPPLILRRPSPDSAPCEITVLFTQQHEIKQVYVRSTAKVYEIYCATNETNENEYLCTVRCGIAARDEEVQLEVDGVGSVSTNSEKSLDEVHLRTDSGSSTDADGWVDVKLHNASRVNAEDNSFSKKEENCVVQINQDRFEATAEISDGDPVVSITLRLLSIQSGDYICIDEVYVFADPVISADDNSSIPSMESSSGSAMLSMFMPTLLQLSKSRTNKVQENSGSSALERIIQNTEQRSTATTSTATDIVQAEVLSNTVHNGSFVHQPNNLVQTLNPENVNFTDRGNHFPCSKIEQTLDELVSRISKIEDFCLRFEQNMLKPIINMETRLERVEQQLESFINNPTIPRTGCITYATPEFSCNGSESNSIGTGGNEVTLKSETVNKDDCFPPESCLQASDSDSYAQSTTNVSKLPPGLIISAPEFSYIEEDEESDSVEAVKDSPKILKKPMSINDALASALTGFVTSTLTKPLECSDAVEEAEIVVAKRSRSPSPSNEHQLFSTPIDGGDNSGKDAMGIETNDLAADEETNEVINGSIIVVLDESSRKSHSSATDSTDVTENSGSIAGIECIESGETCVSDICSLPSGIGSALLKDVESSSEQGIPNAVLQEIIEMPSLGIVDFGVPVLDVKFSYLEDPSAKNFLESFLVDMPALEGEVPYIQEDCTNVFNDQSDLVLVEDEDTGVSESVDNKLLYAEDDISLYMHSESEHQDSVDCSNQGMYANLI